MEILIKHKTNKIPERDLFLNRLVKVSTGCWIWTMGTIRNGYGRLRINHKNILAHRRSWELHYGPIPDGICVLHKCDIRTCCNPDHLFLGTYQDNSDDKINKGRTNPAHGTNHGCSILTEQQAMLAKACPWAPRDAALCMALIFNVSVDTIRRIRRGNIWEHLPEPTEEQKQQAIKLLKQK